MDRNKKNTRPAAHDKNIDGVDVEFSRELADQDDLEALARAEAADQRAINKTDI